MEVNVINSYHTLYVQTLQMLCPIFTETLMRKLGLRKGKLLISEGQCESNL